MRIVLDTNVLVAGLLSPFGPCAEIVRMVTSGALILCLDARILTEYHEVLRRPKFRFELSEVEALLDYIEHSGVMVASVPLRVALPDRDDEPFLEVAISGGVECLVTGNGDDFPTELCRDVLVLTPREFLETYRRR